MPTPRESTHLLSGMFLLKPNHHLPSSKVTFQAILMMKQFMYPPRISAPSAKFKVLSNHEKRRGSPRQHARHILNTSSAVYVEVSHAATASRISIYTSPTLPHKAPCIGLLQFMQRWRTLSMPRVGMPHRWPAAQE